MHRPDSIEDILSRLIPPALSESGQARMEAMIDELAGPQTAAHPEAPAFRPYLPSSRPPIRWRMVGGIAAAAAIMLGALIAGQRQLAPSASFATVTRPAFPALTLLEESGRVDDASNAGTVEESDGTSLQAWKYHVVEKDRMKDRQTGLVVEVSQPRDEFLLMPVSAF
jgi:hypothetical protein